MQFHLNGFRPGDPAIAEAEINPLIVRPAGDGVIAVDALVRLAPSAVIPGRA